MEEKVQEWGNLGGRFPKEKTQPAANVLIAFLFCRVSAQELNTLPRFNSDRLEFSE